MKLNVRIILIFSLIIILVSATSSVIYYSFTNTIIQSQNSKRLLNSSSSFAFFLGAAIDNIDENFVKYFKNGNLNSQELIDSTDIDFVFLLDSNNVIKNYNSSFKESIPIELRLTGFNQFINNNPNLILRFNKTIDGKTIFYGKVINEKFLNDAAEVTRANISLIINNLPYNTSNENTTGSLLPNVISSAKQLRFKQNYDLISTELEYSDFLAVKYQPKNILTSDQRLMFVVFDTYSEAAEFRSSSRIILLVIILTGVILSIIFVLLFTAKFRRQISLLTNSAELTRSGDLSHRVPIVSKDEIGILSETFNNMLDEIRENENLEKEYSDFIALINQNPTLKEFSEATLNKILSSIGFSFGALYLVEKSKLILLDSKGIDNHTVDPTAENNIYSDVIRKKEPMQLEFYDDPPILKASVVEIKIKFLYVAPIIFGNEIIGILEIASETIPKNNPSKYIEKIKEQLAIGLNNARSFETLENIVRELKQLNEQYQEQNKQIIGKNEQLVELHKKLEEKANELEEEREKAIELSHLKSQFLASMSHELKTPLNSIIGLSELTEKDSSTLTKTKDRVKIVLRNSKKLLSMINNILEFSKIESGKFELSNSYFLLSHFLNDLYISSEPLFSEKNLEFQIVFKNERDLGINTDKQKLEHVLLNLISNAIKFTEKGCVSIQVSKPADNEVKFEVIDTGIGISEEDQLTIFQEFKQLDAGNQRKYSGAGLGLAICKSYAELLNAKLEVSSKIGEGSNFSINIPCTVSDELELPSRYQSAKPIEDKSQKKVSLQTEKENSSIEDNKNLSNTPIDSGRKRSKILIVDDDNDTLFTVGEILQNLGYETLFATNGIECLTLLENYTPDLVLLDIMMPQMDGFETIKKIRSSSKYTDLNVIALTAHAMLDDKYIIEQSGFNDLLTKPIDGSTIQIKIKKALYNKERR